MVSEATLKNILEQVFEELANNPTIVLEQFDKDQMFKRMIETYQVKRPTRCWTVKFVIKHKPLEGISYWTDEEIRFAVGKLALTGIKPHNIIVKQWKEPKRGRRNRHSS